MKNYSIFNITKALVNIHFFLSVISFLVLLFFSFFKEEEIPQKDGKLLNLQGKYVSVNADWDVVKDFTFKNSDKISPAYYLEKRKETGMLYIRSNERVAIMIIIQNLLTFALYILIAYFLKEIFNSANEEKIFTIKNAHRIRNIGLALIFGGFLNLLHGFFLSDYVREIIMEFGKMKFQTSFFVFGPQNSFFLGFLLLALSQVFKRGVEIQEENELTV